MKYIKNECINVVGLNSMSWIKIFYCLFLLCFLKVSFANTIMELLYRDKHWLGGIDKAYGLSSEQVALIREPSNQSFPFLKLGLNISYANIASHRENTPDSSKSISIVSLGPDVRFYPFENISYPKPYIELNISPSWLSNTVFDNRNLGIHFSFKDTLGFGLKLEKHLISELGVKITHYSNAGLSDHNRGITLPLLIFLGLNI